MNETLTPPETPVRVTRDSRSLLPPDDRRPTLVFPESFEFVQRIQRDAAADRNLPTFDHGTLTSAALALVAELPEVQQQIIDKALLLIVQRRHLTRGS